MSKKVIWAEVDKRIRNRRTDWTTEELKALEGTLKKLPDLAEDAEIIQTAQPALAQNDDSGAPN